jgi:beta-lactam-binding protein with PASTA domain
MVWKIAANGRPLIVAILTPIVMTTGIAACSHSQTSPPLTASSPNSRQDIVMPSLLGKYWMNAERELRSLGWTGSLDKGPDIPVEPENRRRIIRQTPSAGEHIKSDDRITIQFGN